VGISLLIPLHTRSCVRDIIGLHYSEMCMPMSEHVRLVSDLKESRSSMLCL
jgi:hypothetical protein